MAPLDELLLAEAREAQTAQAHAQAQAELARARFTGAVRRLHEGGASTREIARAFDLSHQRVHQLVTGWHKPSGASCSFCGAERAAVHKLIAGPGVFVCDGCVALAARAEAADADALSAWAEKTSAQPPPAKGRGKGDVGGCSLCGKTPAQVRYIAASDWAHICAECLDLCQEIITEEFGSDP